MSGRKKIWKDILTYVVLVAAACIFTLPTAAMIGTAFKGDSRALSDKGLFPSHPELSAFRFYDVGAEQPENWSGRNGFMYLFGNFSRLCSVQV